MNDQLVGERYEIRSQIGEGGMQVVFEAFDTVFRRSVALKRAKNKSGLKRFQRSATLSARINHPNVAKTLDYFAASDGTQYLVEELIPGGDLQRSLLSRVEFTDPYLTARLFHYLAKGLRAAHEAGVVHRDIKPNNILFEAALENIHVKFTDFGIAKMAEDEMAEAIEENGGLSSTSSTFLGAIPYMAPEMLKNTRKATFPSDVWSVAAVVYEALTGRRPFGTGVDAFDNIRSGQLPEDPAAFVPMSRQFRPIVDDIWSIMKDCFAKDQTVRPTADALVARCEALSYPASVYDSGTIKFRRYNYGFILSDADAADVQYHSDSVFGNDPAIGDRVLFASYPGNPQRRAMPVMKLRVLSRA